MSNDMADAEAICEAVSRPNIRFVAMKTVEQQAILSVHRARQGFVKARTAQPFFADSGLTTSYPSSCVKRGADITVPIFSPAEGVKPTPVSLFLPSCMAAMLVPFP